MTFGIQIWHGQSASDLADNHCRTTDGRRYASTGCRAVVAGRAQINTGKMYHTYVYVIYQFGVPLSQGELDPDNKFQDLHFQQPVVPLVEKEKWGTRCQIYSSLAQADFSQSRRIQIRTRRSFGPWRVRSNVSMQNAPIFTCPILQGRPTAASRTCTNFSYPGSKDVSFGAMYV